MKMNEKRLANGLWWDRNWPVLEGCTPCSPACDNCLAAEYTHRFAGSLPYLHGLTYAEGGFNGMVRMREDQLDLPLRTRKPTVWFVAERSDLFHPAVPDEYLDRVFAVMAMAPQHTFMVLTKRPERAQEYISVGGGTCIRIGIRQEIERMGFVDIGATGKALPNVWLGTTVWDQASADRNIPYLLRTPAAHRFVSVEPMLGPINLEIIRDVFFDAGMPVEWQRLEKPGIDWVICGGESGRNARPVHPNWVRSLRDHCAAADVPFFLKQMHICGRLEKAPLLDGAQHLEFPHV